MKIIISPVSYPKAPYFCIPNLIPLNFGIVQMSDQIKSTISPFHNFLQGIEHIPLPQRFTFPFYYSPHPLCILAAEELQDYLKTQTDWEHNFGIDPKKTGMIIGKMFGVLVVQDGVGQLGYLSAFSGKMAGVNNHPGFVPPIFDMLDKDGFFRKEEEVLNALNRKIEKLETANDFTKCREALRMETEKANKNLLAEKAAMREEKKLRKQKRIEGKVQLSAEDFAALMEELKGESIRRKNNYNRLKETWRIVLADYQQRFDQLLEVINKLKTARKNKSAALQKKLFDQYHFLTIDGKSKSLEVIFSETDQHIPPAGSGECAAPKLLQYAFKQQLKPIAMAEFWWGQSPKSEIRKHGQYYPACRGKCKPILGHMLKSMEVDENPLLKNPALGKKIETIYEDDYLLVVNKPAEFLSVPGKKISDSVASRMKAKYPKATGPLIVHRLDMSTSGLMLIAKSHEIHKLLQRQFIKRTVKKRYVAILDGIFEKNEGLIDLPIRVDLDDRPRQLVCYEYGKEAQTKWKVIERNNHKTKVHFFPITGRTHQLRVHAAHVDGLNTPIIGDDLYGKKGKRLCLHAEWLEFIHPISKERMTVEVAAQF